MAHIEGRKYEKQTADGNIVSYQRICQIKNRDKFNDYRKTWREANKDKIAEYNKAWRKNNRLASEMELSDAEKF